MPTSQNLSVPSRPAETTEQLSGEKAAEVTQFSCPLKVSRHFALAASYRESDIVRTIVDIVLDWHR
jgi:hypothetical protein